VRDEAIAPEEVATLAVDELGLDTDTAFTDVEDAVDETDDEAAAATEAPRATPPATAPPAAPAPRPTPAPRPGVQPRGRQQRGKKRR
jgi:hypothetical protein